MRATIQGVLAAGLLLALANPGAHAADLADGKALAEKWCSHCHLTGPGQKRARDTAPTFTSIARMPSTTEMSLKAFLQTPHVRMPDYQLTRAEIDDLTAYILSLRSH
ncbi:MAG: c-type cytochrome [Betaproteobacteria bacterium]|nr:c-type cytochrome [Betaproteobacteria bacterium]